MAAVTRHYRVRVGGSAANLVWGEAQVRAGAGVEGCGQGGGYGQAKDGPRSPAAKVGHYSLLTTSTYYLLPTTYYLLPTTNLGHELQGRAV